MICPKCGGENVHVQVVTEQKLVKKKHKILWWILIGWWWVPIIFCVKWLIFTLPALIFALFRIGGKKRQIKNIHKSVAVCNDCGHHWEV